MSVLAWCAQQVARKPRPFYCADGRRHGPTCFDCSGFTAAAYRQGAGVEIPKDSQSVARWAVAGRLTIPVATALPGDLVIYDRYGQPTNSAGPRGHIGIVKENRGARMITYESSPSKGGVGIYDRPRSFWLMAVRVPDANTGSVGGSSMPQPIEEEDDLTPAESQMLKDLHAWMSSDGKQIGPRIDAASNRTIGTLQTTLKELTGGLKVDHNRVIGSLQTNLKDMTTLIVDEIRKRT